MLQKARRISLTKYHIFIAVATTVKIMAMLLFSSDYQNELFLPFVSFFIENKGVNPYAYFYNMGVTDAFPYPPAMLFIESLGGMLIKLFHVTNFLAVNFLFKLPSLLFDIAGLCILTRLCSEKRRYVLVLYYASPVILFAVYMHGQLDLLPTVLLLAAIYNIISDDSRLRTFGGGTALRFGTAL